MSSKTFKLSTLTILIVSATQANAALYRVVEVDSSGNDSYSAAIESGAVSGDDLGCFGTTSCGNDDYKLASDTRKGFAGFSYKQEVPFSIDNRFYYLDQDDIENYCDNELGYSTCESWAYNRWFGLNNVGGLYRERQAWNLGSYTSNASAYLQLTNIDSPSATAPTGSSLISNSKNVVVNAIEGTGTDTTIIGNSNSGYFSINGNAILKYRDRGFYGSTSLLPKSTADGAVDIVEEMGRTMAFDSFVYDSKTYVVGSGSVAPFAYSDADKDYFGDVGSCVSYSEAALHNNCQNFAFAMKPYIWQVKDNLGSSLGTSVTGVSASLWSIDRDDASDTVSTSNVNDYSAQGSIRSVVIPSDGTYKDKPVLVGYNTDEYSSRLLMQAAVFYPNATFDSSGVVENAWSTTFISDATVRVSGDYVHSNSVAKDINNNLLVIGEAKRYGDTPEAGAANNRLFIANASNGSPSAAYFSGGIFFAGAGGEANAINNFNEVVGQIDAETNREVNGKKRRRRAYIYPYNGTGTEAERRSIFSDQAWWIDSLTNGGSYSSANNYFRVVNATDINDAGVISATALKCSVGGYDSTAHNAYCGGGSGKEEIVAVKLIPISGATSSDIENRPLETTTVSRSGGGLGIYALTLLALISFRRRK
ncbi:DUF3466 family protein [Vibrio sp. DW001]|uniref:DUF3466 family protein n=1 Tax=Vibrio sp. DW001 TaxID=2912315 RepID=UPI0023B1C280|nr:DUF3466 family protein [Vibrio sp. DW001]WED28238.1 DUF3466 family protein [Vibrio sp. DW001]